MNQSKPDRTFKSKLFYFGDMLEVTVLVFGQYFVIDPSECKLMSGDLCNTLHTLDGKEYYVAHASMVGATPCFKLHI